MVRGLARGEVEPADFLKVLAKELRVSSIVGAVLGLVNGLRIYLMYTFIFACLLYTSHCPAFTS